MALILSRKDGESLVIGDDIRVTVKEIRGNRVSLVFDAPKGIRIMRAECVDREFVADPGSGPLAPFVKSEAVG